MKTPEPVAKNASVQVKYTVHSCVEQAIPIKAMVGDREIDATVPGLIVELTNEQHGHTFKFTPKDDKDLEAHKKMFEPDTEVVVQFSKGA